LIVFLFSDTNRDYERHYGDKIVCIDSTHGTNIYEFLHITIMVVDEHGEGLPAAWAIANKEDTTMLIMNHDSGFIIGIANVFCKNPTPKTCLKKHPPTKNNPLLVLCNEYRSTSKYQVKRKKHEHL